MGDDIYTPALSCDSVQTCYAQGGWLLVAALALTAVLRAWSSSGASAYLAARWPVLAWPQLPLWARWLASVLVGVAASVLAAVAAGQSWWAGLLGALPAIVASAGIDRHAGAVARIVAGQDGAPPAPPAPPSEAASIRTPMPSPQQTYADRRRGGDGDGGVGNVCC